MKHLPGIAACCVALAACGQGSDPNDAAPAAPPSAAPQVVADGLVAPTAAVHDPEPDLYLVACAAADSGFVSRIAPDGRVADPRWIDGRTAGVGLRSPGGIALVGDEVWITDQDRVRRFDRRTGAPRGEVPIPGATGLDGIAAGPGDAVHVCGRATIWRIGPDGAVGVVLDGIADDPTGLAAAAGDLFVAIRESGRFAMVASDGLQAGFALPTADLGGIVRTPDRRWFAASRAGRCVYEIDAAGSAQAVVAGLDGPTGLGFDATRSRLLVALTDADQLAIVPIAPRRE